MSAQIHDRADLIAMLKWQFDMGVDESLLDYPDGSSQPVRLDELLAMAGGLDGLNAGLVSQEVLKSARSENGLKENDATNVLVEINRADDGPTNELSKSLSLASMTSLVGLQAGLAGLDECSLKHTASNLCFADGNPGARLMIIGEVPGRDEDRLGIPFVGDAGRLMDRMLQSFGLDRTSTYLINLLPWRPPGNRSPTSEELTILKPWIFRHIQLAKPDVVLLLGGAPAKLFFNSRDGIIQLRGVWRDLDFGDGVIRPTLASLHPAYLLRSPAQKRFAFEDLLLLTARLNVFDANDKSS